MGQNSHMTRFGAPWGPRLTYATLLGAALLLAMPFVAYVARPGAPLLVLTLFAVAAVVTIVTAALFTIRGYRLDERGLHVERLFWSDRIPLDGLRKAWADHEAMAKSMRLFGNSGLFCIAGIFTNRKLGRYRAFATDPPHAVVLELPTRTIVVTPNDPWEFQAALRELCPSAQIGAARAD
jgi:Bacterial PH domain